MHLNLIYLPSKSSNILLLSLKKACACVLQIPSGLQHVVPVCGDTVCGHWLPGGTSISKVRKNDTRLTENGCLLDSCIGTPTIPLPFSQEIPRVKCVLARALAASC